MIRRVLLAVLLAGLAVGLVMALVQHMRLTPLIISAEALEHVAHGHSADAHAHGTETWSPSDGWERTFYTSLTTIITTIGFAALLAGISLILNVPVTRNTGWMWGICGFVAVSLMPALGLPPELPGMAKAAVTERQIWWLATIMVTGFALFQLTLGKNQLWIFAALVLAAVPHIFVPTPPEPSTATIAPELVAKFVTSSLAANMLMWILIGVFLGHAMHRLEGKPNL